MYLAKGDNQTAAKYFEGAAVQLRDYIEELYGEEEAEAKEWLLHLAQSFVLFFVVDLYLYVAHTYS